MQLSVALVSSFLLLVLGASSAAPAAELVPTLGKKGKLLLEEDFSGASVPKGWSVNTGTLAIKDGALAAGELAKDQHIGAFRKPLLMQDCAIQLDFKLNGARRLDLGFDPAPGELKKKGHLLSLTLTPTGWNLTEHNDKANPASKAIAHAKNTTTFAADQWHTLLLEVKGEQVIAHIDGKAPLKASAPDFRVKKPGLVFRVGGKDGQAAFIDNVRVWQLD